MGNTAPIRSSAALLQRDMQLQASRIRKEVRVIESYLFYRAESGKRRDVLLIILGGRGHPVKDSTQNSLGLAL